MSLILIIVGIAILPYVISFAITGILFAFAIGCAVGLPVGIFCGIKNYMLSIKEGINNKIFKDLMTIIAILVITLLMFATIYFLASFLT
jgi:hypothetical protein